MSDEQKRKMQEGRARAKMENAGEGDSRSSPIQAIKEHCRKCCNCPPNSYAEVGRCHSHRCALWPFRFGKRPETAREEGKLVDPKKFVCTCGLKGTECDGRGGKR